MKKLIFLLLLSVLACSDQELTPTTKIKEVPINSSPQSCIELNESKSFFLYENTGALEYGYDPDTYSRLASYPVNSFHMLPYSASVIFRNLSNTAAYLYIDGVLNGTIAANGQRTVTWSSAPTCHECVGSCPYYLDVTYHWYIVPKTGNPCSITIQLARVAASPNEPTTPVTLTNYVWHNTSC